MLVILIDDVGFGASSAFGGHCQTPGELKVTGAAAACDRVLDLFDKFEPAKNTMIPTEATSSAARV